MNPQRPFRSCRDANSTVSKRTDKSARDSQCLATPTGVASVASVASAASFVSSPSSQMKIHMRETLFDAQKQNYAWQWWKNQLAKGETPWIRFRPKEKYCANEGFIPYQYRAMIPVEKPTIRYNRVIQKQVLKHGYRGVHYAMGWLELFDLIATFGIISTESTSADSLSGRPPALLDTESLSKRPPILLDYKGPPLNVSANALNDACNNKRNAGVRSTRTNQNKGKGRLEATMLQGSTRAKKKQHTNKPTLPTSIALEPKKETSMSTATLQGLLSIPTPRSSAAETEPNEQAANSCPKPPDLLIEWEVFPPPDPKVALEPKKETSMCTATLQGLLSNPTPHSPAAETEPNQKAATSYPTPPGLLIEEEVYPPEPESNVVFLLPDSKTNLSTTEPNPDPNFDLDEYSKECEMYQVQRMNAAFEWGFRNGSTAQRPPWMEN
jgi:hypothetical protein